MVAVRYATPGRARPRDRVGMGERARQGEYREDKNEEVNEVCTTDDHSL